jgi:uncharacterized protein YbcI
MTTDELGAARERGPLSKITGDLVRLHAEYFGKGPVRARTDFVGTDIVLSVLRDALTPVERTLIARGQGQQVHDLRRSFQSVMEPEFREAIERRTGRVVSAFMSQLTLEPDIAIEVFFLEPEGSEGRP